MTFSPVVDRPSGRVHPRHTAPRYRFGHLILAVVVLLCAIVGRAWSAPDSAANNDVFGDSQADIAGAPPTGVGEPLVGDSELTGPIAPPIPPREVVAAAYRAAAVADEPTASWRLRSRLVALIPWLSTRVGRDQSWRDVADPTLGYRDVWDVRATWHLDRLVFDSNELRISTMAIQRRRERHRIAIQVIHLYYRWLVAEAAALKAAHKSPQWAVRSGELLAQLDALTEGWFSAALSKRQVR